MMKDTKKAIRNRQSFCKKKKTCRTYEYAGTTCLQWKDQRIL